MQTLARKTQRIDGIWHNQYGSEVELLQDDAGKLAGTFRIPKVSSHNNEFPLTGFVTGNVVAFAVVFPEKESATAWSGEILSDGSIRALWHMVLDAHSNEQNCWKSTWTGADTFERGESPKETSAKTPPSHPFFCGLV